MFKNVCVAPANMGHQSGTSETGDDYNPDHWLLDSWTL